MSAPATMGLDEQIFGAKQQDLAREFRLLTRPFLRNHLGRCAREYNMRIAVIIIALCVFVIFLLQSCAVGVGGSLGKSETLSQGAAIGVMLAFMYVLGAAFASGVPLVSTVVFAFGALVAIPAGAQAGGFSDLTIWGWLSAILAVLSIFGWREKKRREAK